MMTMWIFILLWLLINTWVVLILWAAYKETLRLRDMPAYILCVLFSFPVMFGIALVCDAVTRWYEQKRWGDSNDRD